MIYGTIIISYFGGSIDLFADCKCCQNEKMLACQKNILKIVLFKSLKNSKRRNEGNFMSKSNSNKIKLCGGGGQQYLVLNKISTL